MAALDDPERYTFHRSGNKVDGKAASEIAAAWLSVRSGPALARHFAKTGLEKAMRGVKKWQERQKTGLRPGLTRRGKDISNAGDPDTR